MAAIKKKNLNLWERKFCSLYFWVIKKVVRKKKFWILRALDAHHSFNYTTICSRITNSFACSILAQTEPTKFNSIVILNWLELYACMEIFRLLNWSAMSRRGQTLSPEVKIILLHCCHMFLFLIHCSLTKARTRAHVIRIYYRLMASGNHGCCAEWKTEMETLRMFHERAKKIMIYTHRETTTSILNEDVCLRCALVWVTIDHVHIQTVVIL